LKDAKAAILNLTLLLHGVARYRSRHGFDVPRFVRHLWICGRGTPQTLLKPIIPNHHQERIKSAIAFPKLRIW
jgi:hypothetical protein